MWPVVKSLTVVVAGVPAVMQAMLDEVGPKLKTGAKLMSETIRGDVKEGDVGTELGLIAKAHPGALIDDIADPPHTHTVGEIGPPLEGNTGISSREGGVGPRAAGWNRPRGPDDLPSGPSDARSWPQDQSNSADC